MRISMSLIRPLGRQCLRVARWSIMFLVDSIREMPVSEMRRSRMGRSAYNDKKRENGGEAGSGEEFDDKHCNSDEQSDVPSYVPSGAEYCSSTDE